MRHKNYLFLVLLCLLNLYCLGQSNELHFKTFLNNLSFLGSGASYETYNETPINKLKSPFVENPYGTNGKIGYGLGLAFQRNTKSNLFFGLSSSIERLTVQIKSSGGIIYNNRIIAGSGSNKMNLNYLNLHPYIGLRAIDETTRIEFKLVSDFAFLIKSKEQLIFKSNENTFKFDHNRDHPERDLRIGLGSAIYIKRFTFNIEYLLGLVNFDPYKNSPLSDVENPIYSQVFRFGIGYVILKSNLEKNNNL